MEKHTLDWFIEKIGKRVFPSSAVCKCDDCKNRIQNGLLIENDEDAKYLFYIQGEHDIFYFDKKI